MIFQAKTIKKIEKSANFKTEWYFGERPQANYEE